MPKSDRSLLSCLKVTQCSTSEIGDARCTTLALYWSKSWQLDHCQHPQNANLDGSMCPGWWKQSFQLRLLSLVWFQVRATSCNLTSSKSAWKSTPKCTWICWRMWWSSGASAGRWQTLGDAAGLGAGPQVHRDPHLASGVLRLCTLLSLAPLLPRPEPAGLLRLVIHPQHDPPTTPKPPWSLPSTEYSPSSRRRLWKRHAPSSGSVLRRWLRLKAATLNRYQLYYILKLPELIFSIKVLK